MHSSRKRPQALGPSFGARLIPLNQTEVVTKSAFHSDISLKEIGLKLSPIPGFPCLQPQAASATKMRASASRKLYIAPGCTIDTADKKRRSRHLHSAPTMRETWSFTQPELHTYRWPPVLREWKRRQPS